jgi:hypothetical protein
MLTKAQKGAIFGKFMNGLIEATNHSNEESDYNSWLAGKITEFVVFLDSKELNAKEQRKGKGAIVR